MHKGIRAQRARDTKTPSAEVSSVLRALFCSAACISLQSSGLEETSLLQTEVAVLQSLGSALISDKWTAAAVSQEIQAPNGESTRTTTKKKNAFARK